MYLCMFVCIYGSKGERGPCVFAPFASLRYVEPDMHVEMLQGPRVDVSGLWFRENQNHQNQKKQYQKN